MKAFKHLCTILKHKYWVWYIGRKLHIGWQTFWHDISKFSITEFSESIKYYTGTRSPIDTCKELNGYSMAWLHHRGSNPHHYEFWYDNFDTGGKPLAIPNKYKLEMVCDFLAAGITYCGKDKYTFKDAYNWWNNKCKSANAMHQDCKKFLTELFSFLNEFFSETKVTELSNESWIITYNKIVEILKL